MNRFLAIYNLVKKQKSFYGRYIQVSVHLSLKFRGRKICQGGYIFSSTAPGFVLGHDMGRFASFLLGYTQLLHHFLGSKKVTKKSKL